MLPQTEIVFYTSQVDTAINFLVAPQWPCDQNLKSLNDEHQSVEKDHTILAERPKRAPRERAGTLRSREKERQNSLERTGTLRSREMHQNSLICHIYEVYIL